MCVCEAASHWSLISVLTTAIEKYSEDCLFTAQIQVLVLNNVLSFIEIWQSCNSYKMIQLTNSYGLHGITMVNWGSAAWATVDRSQMHAEAEPDKSVITLKTSQSIYVVNIIRLSHSAGPLGSSKASNLFLITGFYSILPFVKKGLCKKWVLLRENVIFQISFTTLWLTFGLYCLT